MVQKLLKLDKKWGRYGILKFPVFSENISCTVLMNIQMSELVMSFPHNFLHICLQKWLKINISVSHVTLLLTLYPPKLNGKLCLFSHTSSQGYVFICFFQKMKTFTILCIMTWHHQFTHWTFIRTGQDVFYDKNWHYKMSYFPYF